MTRTASPVRLMAMVALVAILGAVGVTVAALRRWPPRWPRWTARVAPAAERAMWVWDTSDPQAVVALATSRGIGQLYAAVPPHVDSSPKLAELQQLVALADAAGPAGRRPRRRPRLGRQPRLGGHQLAAAGARHRPVHRGPRRHRALHDRRPGRRTARPSSRSTSPPSTPCAPPPRARRSRPTSRSGSTRSPPTARPWTARSCAAPTPSTVMAYRNLADGPDGTIALAADEIAAGAQLGRPVRIGQETNFLGTDPTEVKQTFHGHDAGADGRPARARAGRLRRLALRSPAWPSTTRSATPPSPADRSGTLSPGSAGPRDSSGPDSQPRVVGVDDLLERQPVRGHHHDGGVSDRSRASPRPASRSPCAPRPPARRPPRASAPSSGRTRQPPRSPRACRRRPRRHE